VNRASYTENIDWKIWLLKARKKEIPRGGIGALENTHLNIRVRGSEGISIDNNIVKASLQADILVIGALSAPVILGRVDIKQGYVYFRNNKFMILNASADFADPKRLNPVIYISAESTVSGYDVRMRLEGQLDHFDLSLSSTPTLEETEILSLLTVGSIGKEAKGIQGGIGLDAATSFLGGQLQDVVQERLQKITGLDRIAVESQLSKVTGKNEPWVTVTKQIVKDKISVTYARTFSSVAGEIVKVEYALANNVSLVGTREETGAFSGTVKFRFEFK
jgi:translocation and assembly module TamB